MSWFKSKQKNRLHRHDLRRLDSKLRARSWMQRQTKLFVGWIAIALGLSVFGLGTWLAVRKGLNEMFFGNDQYLIRDLNDIIVDNNGGSLKRELVLSYLKLKPGQNLLALDLVQLRQDLELWPVIESARVTKELPHRLLIQFWERIPIATISSRPAGAHYQIDRHGVVIDLLHLLSYQKNSNDFQKKLAALPEIAGVALSDLKIANKINSPEVSDALGLIQKMDHAEVGGELEIRSIDVSQRGVLKVTLLDDTVIKISLSSIDKQLKRLVMILEDARDRSEQISTVDLTMGRDVPVTRREFNP